jgi:hypothetical protein
VRRFFVAHSRRLFADVGPIERNWRQITRCVEIEMRGELR